MKTLLNRWKLENQANQNGVKVMDDVNPDEDEVEVLKKKVN